MMDVGNILLLLLLPIKSPYPGILRTVRLEFQGTQGIVFREKKKVGCREKKKRDVDSREGNKKRRERGV